MAKRIPKIGVKPMDYIKIAPQMLNGWSEGIHMSPDNDNKKRTSARKKKSRYRAA